MKMDDSMMTTTWWVLLRHIRCDDGEVRGDGKLPLNHQIGGNCSALKAPCALKAPHVNRWLSSQLWHLWVLMNIYLHVQIQIFIYSAYIISTHFIHHASSFSIIEYFPIWLSSHDDESTHKQHFNLHNPSRLQVAAPTKLYSPSCWPKHVNPCDVTHAKSHLDRLVSRLEAHSVPWEHHVPLRRKPILDDKFPGWWLNLQVVYN